MWAHPGASAQASCSGQVHQAASTDSLQPGTAKKLVLFENSSEQARLVQTPAATRREPRWLRSQEKEVSWSALAPQSWGNVTPLSVNCIARGSTRGRLHRSKKVTE